MPSEMVRRAGQAIADSNTSCHGCVVPCAKQPEKCDCWADARAVIAALREPTEAMDVAGRFRCYGIDLLDGTMRTVCGGFLGESATAQWRRMIDAALAD